MRRNTGDQLGIIGRRRDSALELLLVPGPDGWSLPHHPYPAPPAMRAAIADRFGLSVTTRDRIEHRAEHRTGEPAAVSLYYVHEVHTPPQQADAPREGRWFRSAELAATTLSSADQRAVLERWFADSGEAAADTPGRRDADTPGRPAWTREGWYATAAAWATEELRRSGNPPVGAPEQPFLRAWSFQLRIPTAAGGVYFKASPPAFGHEAAVSQLLSRYFPVTVPRVLAIDADRHWMLTEDFGEMRRDRDAPTSGIVDSFVRMVPRLAVIQHRTEKHTEALRKTGCPDHRPARLAEIYEELVAGTPDLDDGERRRLTAYSHAFRGICAELESYGVPETLVHLDIWRGNFTFREEEPLIFDWAESVLGHPFVSLDVALRDLRSAVPDDLPSVRRTRDSYLRLWRDHAPPERLAEAAELAATVGVVSRAALWRDALAGLDEARARPYAGTVAAQLRELLAAAAV
ncbi:hypothetical protein [Streptomyces sp. NPDC088400]|uniref:hypothetical protein n=1 Tax=Streptomyces sp. NPDC088400 TaxID=3365861 RepID=UPI00381EDBD4